MQKINNQRATHLNTEENPAYGSPEAGGDAHRAGRRQHLRLPRLVLKFTLATQE
jgi:hypothetical protein